MTNESATPAGARRGVALLLVHGFTGSRTALLPWARALQDAGHDTALPVLPGHETRWQDMLPVRYGQWIDATERAYDELAADHEAVFVAGLSMGGALALHLATRRDVAGLLLVNPALLIDSPVAPYARFIHPVLRSVAPIRNDIATPGADENAYPRTPVRAVGQLYRLLAQVRSRLPLVDCPVAIFRSATDNVVSDRSLDALLRGLDPAVHPERIALPRSRHVATLDYDAPLLFERSIDFIARHHGGTTHDPHQRVEDS